MKGQRKICSSDQTDQEFTSDTYRRWLISYIEGSPTLWSIWCEVSAVAFLWTKQQDYIKYKGRSYIYSYIFFLLNHTLQYRMFSKIMQLFALTLVDDFTYKSAMIFLLLTVYSNFSYQYVSIYYTIWWNVLLWSSVEKISTKNTIF